jgi:O-antigen ligase
LLVQGFLGLAFLVAVLGVLQPAKIDSLANSLTEQVLYKGKMEQGLLGSRRTPWRDTVAVIKESPWFGSGFGTDRVASSVISDSVFRTIEGSGREHGSSYMALLQYVGLLGVIPFAILLLLVLANVFRACLWMKRTRNPKNYIVPLAMVCLAGMIHAMFEDWMFAAGYYLTLFFWTAAFVIPDFLPRRTAQPAFVSTRLRASSGVSIPESAYAGFSEKNI